MKYFFFLITFCTVLCGCNSAKTTKRSIVLDKTLFIGKTFYNDEKPKGIIGLYFENDSLLTPIPNVSLDTTLVCLYQLKDNNLYRYQRFNHQLISKDSIFILDKNKIQLGSLKPDYPDKVTFKIRQIKIK